MMFELSDNKDKVYEEEITLIFEPCTYPKWHLIWNVVSLLTNMFTNCQLKQERRDSKRPKLLTVKKNIFYHIKCFHHCIRLKYGIYTLKLGCLFPSEFL